MAGQVKHTKLFDVMASADTTLLGVLMRLKAKNTDGIIGGIADAMRDKGIELLNSTAFLAPLLATRGRADAPRAERGASRRISRSATGSPTPSPASTSARRSR